MPCAQCSSSIHAMLRELRAASMESAEVLRIEPTWTIEGTHARMISFKRPEDAEHFFDGLRQAGLSER